MNINQLPSIGTFQTIDNNYPLNSIEKEFIFSRQSTNTNLTPIGFPTPMQSSSINNDPKQIEKMPKGEVTEKKNHSNEQEKFQKSS